MSIYSKVFHSSTFFFHILVSEEEAKFFLNQQNAVDQDTFINNCWSIVKPYLMIDAQIFKPPASETDDGAGEALDMQEEEEHEQDEEGKK